MSNLEKLKKIFIDELEINASDFSDNLSYGENEHWDSIAHMTLVARLEDEFDIMLDTDDIVDMSSVKKAKEILGKYDVTF
nr:acyl carrier protein [Moraxella osloensis]